MDTVQNMLMLIAVEAGGAAGLLDNRHPGLRREPEV
jgi:hypothetical protein